MRIGDYELQERVDSDGVISVYSGRRISDDAPVTLNVLAQQHMVDELLRKRMQREFNSAKTVDASQVIKYLDYIETEEVVAVVTEKLPATSLRALLSLYGALSVDSTIQVVRQIARGLDACHCSGVVHRNVTPENIYITEDKKIKVAKFGLASALNATTLTMTGTMIGSPEYSPPEYLYAAPRDIRGDIYSLGIIIWEVLVGQNPFEGESLTAIFQEKKDILPPPSGYNPEIPAWIDALVANMTAPDPEKRPSSLQPVLFALHRKVHPERKTSNGHGLNCLSCGYKAVSELWFCPYCGQSSLGVEASEQEPSVLLMTDPGNIDVTSAFLAKTFVGVSAEDIRKKYKKKNAVLPIIENITASESRWLTDALRSIQCNVVLRPMSAWYYKVSTLIFFLLGVSILVLFEPMPSSAPLTNALFSWGMKLSCVASLMWAAYYYIRLHYAVPWEIPGKWLAGSFAYDPFSDYLSSGNRIISTIVLIITTLILFIWLQSVSLSAFKFIQARITDRNWSSLLTNNMFVILLAQLVIMKIFVGDIYTSPIVYARTTSDEETTHLRSDFQFFEQLRRFAVQVQMDTFRSLIAECVEHYLTFNRFKKADVGLPKSLVVKLEDRFSAAIESIIVIGEEIVNLTRTSSDTFRRKAEETERRVKRHMDQSAGPSSRAIMEEWKKSQDMLLQHEIAAYMLERQLNNIRLIAGGLHTVTFQLLSVESPDKNEVRNIRLCLNIVSEAVKAVTA